MIEEREIDMRHIFVDFEMHPVENIYKEAKKICGREVIEFGAVMLDDDYKEVSHFKSYVKPRFSSKIRNKYRELTGISSEMIAGAEDFSIILDKFLKWCISLGGEYTIYAWSDSDYRQIEKESKQKGIPFDQELTDMFNVWTDFQKMYCDALGLDRIVSLEKALNLLGVEFSGKIHDALWDARNTAELYRMTKDAAAIEDMRRLLDQALKEREDSIYCLGDIFDFSKLNIAA